MTSQKDRKLFDLRNNEKDFSKNTYSWLAQYDEEDDFLCGKATNTILEISEIE